MEFKVLGPLEVSHDGAPVTVTRRKCQALLALLLSQYPHGVSIEAAADALWPAAEPAKGANSVRVHATYLRQFLVAEPALIPRTTGRYSVAVDRVQIDALRFEDVSRDAREAAASGDPRAAIDLFETALGDWRGDPYSDLREIDGLREEITRLEGVHLDTMEGYATALLDDDRADEACRALEPVIEANLVREMLAARLMLALYRTGRQQDALALFGRVKAALTEDLGLLPSDELQRLADAIVLQRPELDVAGAGGRSRPARVGGRPRQRAAFIGRAAELRALDEAWGRATEGTAQLVYLMGEAGVGKTTVMQHFVERVRTYGATVVIGTCDEDSAESYQPFPDLVRDMLEHAPPTDTVPSLLGELRRLTPGLAHRLPVASEPPEPGAGRQRLFAAVASLLAKPSHPRLLIIEDLHWAGPDAFLMLRHVMRAASGQLMVLGTFRRHELQIDALLREVLVGGRLGHPDTGITVAAMNRHEVAAVINGVAPVDRRSAWLEHLDELTDVSAGNPLRLREVLRQLELEPDAAVADIAPEDVRSLVDRRLHGLDPETRSALQTAAVLGRAFTLPHVASAAGLSTHATLDALEESTAQGLLAEGDRADDFTFAHPLFRNAIYSSLSQSRRARIHIRCGNVLADEGARDAGDGRTAEIARHFVAARPVSDPHRTAEFARDAGDDASRRYAHEEAVDWYRHAVECAIAGRWSSQDVARLRLALGIELELSGQLDAARVEYFSVADIARVTDDLDLFCEAISAATPPSSILDRAFAEVLARQADEALSWMASDDLRRVRVLQAAAFSRLYWEPDALANYTEEAQELAHRSDEALIKHRALVVQYVSSYSFPISDRLALSEGIHAHSRHPSLQRERGFAMSRRLIDLLQAGDIAAFDQELEGLSQSSRVTSIPYEIYWSAALFATRQLMRSASSESESLIDAAATLGRRLQIADSTGMHMLQTFAARYQQGRTREITRDLETPDAGDPPVLAGTALLALAFTESGKLDAARTLLDRVATPDGIRLPMDNFWFGGASIFAGVAAACGSEGQRRTLREALSTRADEFCVFGGGGAVFGTGHHWLARMAVADQQWGAAAAHLAEATRICQDCDAPFWAALARKEAEQLTIGAWQKKGSGSPE